MAHDADDIGRLKAAIPNQFKPAPDAAGALANRFALAERDRFNLAMGFLDKAGEEAASSPGFILPGALSIARKQLVKREEERRYVIEQIIAQIEARNRLIAANLKRLEALDRQETALDDLLGRLKRGEPAELDKNGELKDKDAEAAVQEFEARYGVKVDRNDTDQIATVLQGVRTEQLHLRRSNADLTTENEQDRQLALEMRANPASIPTTVAALETTAQGQRAVNVAAAHLESEQHRKTVAKTLFADGPDQDFALEAIEQVPTDLEASTSVEASRADALKLALPKPA